MIFGLDFDGTYTMDPPLWDMFIAEARKSGHEVIIVTMRYEDTEAAPVLYFKLHEKANRIIYTNRKAKKSFVRMQNQTIHVWIDDQPEWLFEDAL
jgi:hypothetical protein